MVDAQGEKVGKTTGNALFLNAKPAEMYGGIMSFPDEIIILAFELLTEVPVQLIEEHKKTLAGRRVNPMQLKKQLAFEIVKMYHGEQAAQKAQEEFERVFQKGKTPVYDILIYDIKPGKVDIIDLLVGSKLAASRSEAKRLVEQGAVEIDNQLITNYELPITLKNGAIIKVGKRRFIKIRVDQ